MAKQKHSPLPWHVEGGEGDEIWNEAGDHIALCDGTLCAPEDRVNAAHIVKSVNEHPALIAENEALNARVAELEGHLQHIADQCLATEEDAKNLRTDEGWDWHRGYNAAIEFARLSLPKGGS